MHTLKMLSNHDLRSIVDDDACAVAVRRHGVRYVSDMFHARSLAFFLTFKDDLFGTWVPETQTYVDMLLLMGSALATDHVNKVEFMLTHMPMRPTDHIWKQSLVYFTSVGLRHRDPDIRRLFVLRLAAVAVFLLPVPPRVKCRVLENCHRPTP
jgi:hypothetical protein